MNDRASKASFPAMLEMHKAQIALALPKHLNADRMCRIALTSFRMTPKLSECEPASVFAAVIQAAQLGLEPGLNGRAYLIPYGNQCSFIPGWKGLVELANRTGRASVWTGTIYEGQKFVYSQGDSPSLSVEPSDEDAPEKIAYTYAIGRIAGSEWPIIELWSAEKTRKHRDRYNKVGNRHYSFTNWEMYSRKIPLLQVLKYLPASVELETAMALNDAAERGNQGLSVKEAIEGTWAPAPQSDAPPQPDESRTESGRKRPQAKQINDAPPATPTSSAKLADSQRAAIFAKADAYEITSAEIAKAFAVENVVDIGANRFAEVMDWLSDPSTPPNLG